MQDLVSDFVRALRQGGLPVSPAESLDALNTANLIGLTDRSSLKQALGMVLAKTPEHELEYGQIFDRFFAFIDGSHYDSEISQELSDQAAIVSQDNLSGDADFVDQFGDVGPESLIESPLGQQLLSGDTAQLSFALAEAGAQVGVGQMKVFTQQAMFAYRVQQELGMEDLNVELNKLDENAENKPVVQFLRKQRDDLKRRVREYVDQQYLLFAQAEGIKLREQNLQNMSFSAIDHHYADQMAELVRRSARQLARLHSRRKKTTKRGILDARKTIAANAAFDGALFHTKWKSKKIERPKVFVVCDVSGSVSQVARFLLLFIYSLHDVLPRVRSFAFSGQLGEVTGLFERDGPEEAFAGVMEQWANRSTDYGNSISEFERLTESSIDNKSTVIMLGDARNNYGQSNAAAWERIYRKSNRVLWLNPERESSWDTGDSIMSDYMPYCSMVEVCNSLRDLKRILNGLLKYA